MLELNKKYVLLKDINYPRFMRGTIVEVREIMEYKLPHGEYSIRHTIINIKEEFSSEPWRNCLSICSMKKDLMSLQSYKETMAEDYKLLEDYEDEEML
jgi:hypothetical protein